MIEIQPTGLAAELQALAQAPASPRGPKCSVGTVLEAVADDVAATLHQVLDNERVTSVAIAEALSRHGDPVTAYTVARHRRRGKPNGCRCER